MLHRYILAILAALSGCAYPPALPPKTVSFTIGNPYEAGGEWQYPRQFNHYDTTGLATIITDNTARYTADNETYSPHALSAASPVLPLPSILRITNLVNGESLTVRVNDRGPYVPGRVIAVTPRVARLLNFPTGGVVEVAVHMEAARTAALDAALGAGPQLTAAPVAGVTSQSLGPPGSGPGAVQSMGSGPSASTTAPAVQLSGTVRSGVPAPGPLFVQIPGFGRESDAYEMMQRLGGIPARVVPVTTQDRTLYAVNAGPYHSVADADAALQQILSLGITDPAIIVR